MQEIKKNTHVDDTVLGIKGALMGNNHPTPPFNMFCMLYGNDVKYNDGVF